MAASMILATYEDPYFISEDALKGLRGDGVILPTEELGEIEICGHLEICCYCWKSTQLVMRIFDGIDKSGVQVCQNKKGSEKWSRQGLSFAVQPKFSSSSFNDELRVDAGDADVKFVMEYNSEKILSAHSFVLAAQSPVLRKMLTIDMAEKRSGVITITDASYDSLELFLKLLYGSKTPHDLLQLPASDVLKILALAHKYRVVFLMRISCIVIMTYENEVMNVQQIQEMYHAGRLFDIPDLEQRAFQWLKWRRGSAQGYKEVLDLLEELDESFMRKCCSFLFKF